ncbi:hypothetical protein J2741_001724 [Methanolinea mesophila]|uniref:VIT1/CCC1 transporter family protein n=1 Tax=Methanolinea mesophila TaxID=547055 RepID=UPI001AE63634|nr:VIT1/CCC1 transporter family protein [Methanolinea mesophila]MBP1929177.1 hypothetical protein [Methanolinea mesophila]
MRFKGIPFLQENLSLGNRLSECFYGVFMVVIITGLINTGLPPTESTLRILLIVALGVNVSWGIIDGVTAMYGGLVNRADYLRIANAYRDDPGSPEKRDAVARSLQGTMVENLTGEEQSGVIDMIGAGTPVTDKKFPATLSDWKVAIATLLIDFALIFPVIIPYFLIDTVRMAVFVSHTIAIVLLGGIAMVWAGKLGLNTWKAGITIAIISSVAIYSTYLIGW